MKKIVLFGAFLALTVVSLGKEILPEPVVVPEVKGISMTKGQSFSAAFGLRAATTIGTTTATNGVKPPFTPKSYKPY